MRHPMLIVTLLYVAGVVAGDFIPSPGTWSLTTALVLLFCFSFTALIRPTTRAILVPLALATAGLAAQALQRAVLSPQDLRRLAPDQPVIASVRGRLVETPFHRAYERNDEVTLRTQAEIVVSEIRWGQGPWNPAAGRIMVGTPGTVGAPFYGGRNVEIEGVLQRPRGAIAEGTFDYAAYLRRHGIHYQLQVSSTTDWRLQDPAQALAPAPFADRFAAWARTALGRGLPVEDEPLRLLWAMTLGWRTALTGEISEPFMQSGTMHVFAISGLHIALIAGILVAFFRVCRIPRHHCAFLILPLIWLYTAGTGWQASAIRSTVMMSVIIAGWSLRRPSGLLNSLATAAFLILLWDPQQLFQASFQLSFAVVLSLALLTPGLDALRRRLFQYDPWVPDDLRPRWQHWMRRPLDYLGTSTGVSLAAWLGSIPLVAFYFHLFTPISLLANLLIVPLSSGALACSLASLGTNPVAPLFAELFNHSAWFFMTLMIEVSHWASRAPGGCWHMAMPSPLFMTLYYGVLIAVFSGNLMNPRRRFWVLAVLSTLGIAYAVQWAIARGESRLTIVPLRGSASIYAEPGGNQADWLIDCGDESSADFVLKPFLRARGVNRLGNLVLTHGDIHHVGGAALLAHYFKPQRAWLGPVSFRSTAYREAQGLFTAPAIATTVHRGETHPPWAILHPDDSDRFPQADDAAIVLLGEFEGVRVLLLSDLGKPGQNALLSRDPEVVADILVTGIPARSEPVANALLESIRPQVLIVADAEYPATQRASPRLRERLRGQPIPVLYTRETGSLTLTLRRGTWAIRGMDGTILTGSVRRK